VQKDNTNDQPLKKLKTNNKEQKEGHKDNNENTNEQTKKQKEGKDPTRTVYVGNLPHGTKKRALSNHFGEYGSVVSIRQFDKKPKPAYAYVTFATQEQAHAAKAAYGREFRGNFLRVSMQGENVEDENTFCVFVRIPPNTTEVELKEFFSKCGKVNLVRAIHNIKEGKHHAIVNFRKEKGMQEALKKNGEEFKGMKLNIKLSKHSQAANTTNRPASQHQGNRRQSKEKSNSELELEVSSPPNKKRKYIKTINKTPKRGTPSPSRWEGNSESPTTTTTTVTPNSKKILFFP